VMGVRRAKKYEGELEQLDTGNCTNPDAETLPPQGWEVLGGVPVFPWLPRGRPGARLHADKTFGQVLPRIRTLDGCLSRCSAVASPHSPRGPGLARSSSACQSA
jgi:hypothetical protein